MDVSSGNLAILDVLQRASSQDPNILKPAELQLQEWEKQPGFYNALHSILSNQVLEVNVRWMAVLYMKNGVDRYWRKTAPNAISEDEKSIIRQGLLSNFTEPITQIALQRAVIISKVARIDCPKEWPDIFPTLLQAVESTDTLVQHRALLTLHHVVKAIASKRLFGDRVHFQNFTKEIFPFVFNLWNTLTDSFIASAMQGALAPKEQIDLEKALLTLRILRKLAVSGFSTPQKSDDCMMFLQTIFPKIKNAFLCHKQMKSKGIYSTESCEKFIIHLTKVLLSMLEIHPRSFTDLVQPTLELCFYYLFTNDGLVFLFERFVIQCFNLIKNILLCAEYRLPKFSETTKDADKPEAFDIIQRFFTAEVLKDACRKLVGHYFILTQDELNVWDSDPEAFNNDEYGDSWKYSLRPSMSTVFVTIFHEYRDILIPVLLEMINSTNINIPVDDMEQILKKDAIYNAAELCAFDMYDDVDFDQWFTNTLVYEFKIKHTNYRVIRRRVVALLGKWIGIKCSVQLRPLVYECIIGLLSTDEDMVVRLTAATALKYAIDDYEFNGEQFKEYVLSAFDLLFTLLKEAQECETKMQVLNVMHLLLERMGNTLVPQLSCLVQYLPFLWQESDDHNMLRCAIVSTMAQLIKSLGGVPEELMHFLLSIIQLGTNTYESAIVYLQEEALELWLSVLEYSSTMTDELMQLFNNMFALLDYSTENLRTCLYITSVHLLLNPQLVMQSYGQQLMTICASLMGDLKNEGIVMLMRLVDFFIRSVPNLGAETVMPILPKIFGSIYEGEDYPLVMTMYLCILSRILLSSHKVFTNVISQLSRDKGTTDLETLTIILDQLLQKMRNVSQLDQRKLMGLALTNLLTTQSPIVLQRFKPIMDNILETLNDITKMEDGAGLAVDSLVLVEGQSPSDFDEDGGYYETDHERRKKQLIVNDPVHNIVLKDYLQSQMFEMRNQLGVLPYQELVTCLGNDSISQLQEYITF